MRTSTAILRLRPLVRATPTETGIHVRGWTTAVTVDGGRDLWRLWQRLGPALRTGIPAEAVAGLAARPGPWRAAARLVEALSEHGLLAEGPPPPAPGWLDEAAAHPEQAHHRLTEAEVTVLGEGPVAAAAHEAFAMAGVSARPGPAAGDPRLVTVCAAGAEGAPTVVAAAGREHGFVTHPAMHGSLGGGFGVAALGRAAAGQELGSAAGGSGAAGLGSVVAAGPVGSGSGAAGGAAAAAVLAAGQELGSAAGGSGAAGLGSVVAAGPVGSGSGAAAAAVLAAGQELGSAAGGSGAAGLGSVVAAGPVGGEVGAADAAAPGPLVAAGAVAGGSGAAAPELVVAAGSECGAVSVGFGAVPSIPVAVGGPEPVGAAGADPGSVAARLADRLRISGGAPSALVAAVVGAAAAQRVVHAVGGLSLGPRGSSGATWPTVLIATAEPVSVRHHPWVLGGPVPAEAGGLRLELLEALCDRYLGLLPAPETRALPQIPAGLAICRTSLGVGLSPAAARLDAAVRAAELLLGGRPAVGTSGPHADGVLLRRAVFDTVGRQAVAGREDERGWLADPRARRWWTALTVRFGVPARCAVVRLADGVQVARVDADGHELGWAVEADVGTAAMAALFLATARHQARRAGAPADDRPGTVCGAAPWFEPQPATELRPATEPQPATELRQATEMRLQQAMRRLVPTGRHPGPARLTGSRELAAGLAGCGFVIRGEGADHG